MEYDIDRDDFIEVEPPLRIQISYKDREGNVTKRTVDISFFNDGEAHQGYFPSFCHKTKDERTFKIDRISGEVTIIGSTGKAKVRVSELAEYISSGQYTSYIKKAKSQTAGRQQQAPDCLFALVSTLTGLITLPVSIASYC